MSNSKANGVILWEGISKLDGMTPLVCIATLKTSNEKTGSMVQTWILRADVNPVEASKQSMDDATCGSCIHRHSLGGACYANIGQAPNAVYKAYKRGSYPHILDSEKLEQRLRGRAIRFGAYGDPAAVPTFVWQYLSKLASKTTGYTHQINHKSFDPELLNHVMVSADTPKQAAKLQAQGNRTFRVKTEDAPLLENEIVCLSADKGLQCIDCGMCNAATNKAFPSIVINVHGSRSKRYSDKYSKAHTMTA